MKMSTTQKSALHASEELAPLKDGSLLADRSTEVQTRPRCGRFLRDVGLTMGAEVLVLASRVVIVSIFGRWVGAAELAEYLLLSRITAWLLAGAVLGLAVGLPRYVARARGSQQQEPTTYFQAASICLILSSIVIGLIMIGNRRVFAHWLFGDSHRTAFVIALSFMVWGLTAQGVVFGYYRGLLSMARANLLEVCTLVAVPLCVIVVLYRTRSVPLMVGAMGSLDIVISALFAIPIFRRFTIPEPTKLAHHLKELLHYGIPRVPGDFGSAALTALGPVIAAHYLPMAQISAFLLGLTFLMVTGYAAGPLGVVLLSKVSMMLGQNRLDDVRARLKYLVVGVLELSVFACLQLIIFADVAVRTWVGSRYLDQMLVIRLLVVAIPPYLFYMALRSTIDAASVKPLNAWNVLTALMVYLLLIGASVKFVPRTFLLEGIAGSMFITLIVLGSLTLRTFRKLYDVSLPWARSAPSLLAAVGLGAVAFAFRSFQSSPMGPLQAVLLEGGLSSAYLALLTSVGSTWLQYTWRMGLGGRKSWSLPLLRLEIRYQ